MGNIDERSESKRAQILSFIMEHPGAHLRKIKRELNLAMGVIQYHLYALEKERRVISRRRGFYKRYYSTLLFGDRELEIMDVLAQETERDLLLFLMQNPSATQKELSGFARVSPSTINWHMQRLSKSGLIETTREGANTRYLIRVNRSEILTLLKNYHPTTWERWADRLADILE